jgi:diaminopimelate decarboxylase
MDHFLYRDGILHAEDVPLPEIAAAVGTPVYVYSVATLTRHFRLFDEALHGMEHLVCYAMKANSNLAVVRLMADLGAGADVVSAGEYLKARAAGMPGDRIVFSGVGKTRDEMRSRSKAASGSSTSKASPSFTPCPRSPPRWARPRRSPSGSTPTSTPRPTRRSPPARPRTSSASPSPGARGLCARRLAAGDRRRRHRRPHRQPAHRARARSRAYRKVADLTRALRADGHDDPRLDLGGGLGIPYTRSNDAPPLPIDYGAMVRRVRRRPRLRDRDRAGPPHRRQRRRPRPAR